MIGPRFVLGLAVGTASFVAPEYIAEQTPPKTRGGTVSYNQLMITLGILLAYIAGFGLASARASCVTGASWPVDGGMLQMGPPARLADHHRHLANRLARQPRS